LITHPPVMAAYQRAESSVKQAASQTYVVKPGDTLWSIAQRFYGDPFKWRAIYDANQEISNPNVIDPGQQLTIPGASSTPSTDAVSASPVHQEVLSGPMAYIQQAANATGLPLAVVKAQNYVESAYGTNDGPSSAGAMGPWQFMPGTWPLYSSAPFSEAMSWPVSTPAYIAMMKSLLHWSGGNVQMALAAYNAGQGNWQAGLGYANTILAIAG
jgi:LysM repeat protein